MPRRRPYQRSKNPNPIRLTSRDNQILETMHAFDGMLSLKQVDRLFFSGKGRSQARARMRQLFDHSYVDMAGENHIHQVPAGETVYWLSQKGAKVVAALKGTPFSELFWKGKGRWSQILHDLRLNSFRIEVMAACNASPTLKLQQWLPESEFSSNPDTIRVAFKKDETRARRVIPDGFFLIRRPSPRYPGKEESYAYILEIDMATHSTPRFTREKIQAGVAYIKSEAYRKRSGQYYGRWLVVTTGQLRLEHLKAQAEGAGGKGLFYFTVFDAVSADKVLSEPIWQLAGSNEPASIIPDAYLIAK